MSGINVEQLIRKHALQNAVQYDGKAKVKSVMGRVLSEQPGLKSSIKELIHLVEKIVEEINRVSLARQRKLLEDMGLSITVKESELEVKSLPPLPNVEHYRFVHVRFCPNPDGTIHLGGSRAAILCDEYAKMYCGKFTLRFDDSDPRTKYPLSEAYDLIVKDLEWLGVQIHEKVYQSDRLELYYGYAKHLIEIGAAYVCSCKPVEFRKLVLARRACPCRSLKSDEHLARWFRMLEGDYKQGEAVVRIKTDLTHPNPAVRDWPALRIIDTNKFPHPRKGNKYRVWPLFAFCCGIDDHDLEISHIIRGKEHLTNTVRQLFLYDYMNWSYPEAIHYGRLKIIGTILSKSKIREGIANGIYNGWDDPRLGTLMALKKRGYLPQTVRQVILEVGSKPVDATISWDNVQAINRKLLDPIANRYFFIANPIGLIVNNIGRTYVSKLPLHPSDTERGYRTLTVDFKDGLASLLISKNDLKILKQESTTRLIGLFNITVKQVSDRVEAQFHSEGYAEARRLNAPLIHWLPYGTGFLTSIVMPDSSTVEGLAEDRCKKLEQDAIIQFERFGFVRVDSITDSQIIAYYAHR